MSAEPFIAPMPPFIPSGQTRHPGLLEKTREILRLKHYSLRTEESYLGWIRRFVHFHGKRHPRVMGTVLDRIEGSLGLFVRLLYGTGVRLFECQRLRVKDVDFERRQITVRDGKGAKDRVTMLPQALVEPLQAHLLKVKALHGADLAQGLGEVWMPDALAAKYPNTELFNALTLALSRRERGLGIFSLWRTTSAPNKKTPRRMPGGAFYRLSLTTLPGRRGL